MNSFEPKSARFPLKPVVTLGIAAAVYAVLVGIVLPYWAAESRKVDYKSANTLSTWTIVIPPYVKSVRRYEAVHRHGCFEANMDATTLAQFLSLNGLPGVPDYQLESTITTTDCQGTTIKCQLAYGFSNMEQTIEVCQNGIVVGKQRTSQF